jgi:hypothetical protein
MWTYNHERPNVELGGFPPKQQLASTAEFLLLPTVEIGGACRGMKVKRKSARANSATEHYC